jgi:hypothetical protein
MCEHEVLEQGVRAGETHVTQKSTQQNHKAMPQKQIELVFVFVFLMLCRFCVSAEPLVVEAVVAAVDGDEGGPGRRGSRGRGGTSRRSRRSAPAAA